MKPIYRITDAERDAGLPFADSLEQAGALFREAGCLILQNALPASFVDQLAAGYWAGPGNYPDAALADQGVLVGPNRVMQSLPLLPPFDHPRFWAHPIFCSLLEVWLEGPFFFDACTVVTALPGAGRQAPHRDNGFPYGYQQISLQMPPYAVALSIPLVDFTAETGTTALYPGSHRELQKSEIYLGRSGLQSPLKRGDVYFMDYRLVHGGTPNISPWRRPLASLLYTRPWYIDTLNHLEQGLTPLIVPPELLGRLNPRQAYLLSRAPGARPAEPPS